jgi:predicted dehydrogenase
VRIGLVGLGSIGRRHLGNLLALACDVVAFDVSVDARQRAWTDYTHVQYVGALPFAGLDALVIATPIGNHLRWVEEAIARRIPFFVEKALGTLDQLPRWREIAALELPINQVGYNLRFHPKLQTLRAHVDGAEAGQFFLDCDMRQWPGVYGPMVLECSHEIDLALYCGAAATVDAVDV